MEPSAAPTPPPHEAHHEVLHRLWLAAFVQSLVFPIALLWLTHLADFGGWRPAWGPSFFFLALLSALPAAIALMRLHAWRRETPSSRRRLEAPSLERSRRLLLLVIALADLPALGGFVHYLLTAEVGPMLALCLVTVLLVYLAKPPTPPPRVRDGGL